MKDASRTHFGSYRTLIGANNGSVLVLFALVLTLLLTTIGIGVDYVRAKRAQTKLTALADAAALMAVSREGMGLSAAEASVRARKLLVTQARYLEDQGLVLDWDAPANLDVRVTELAGESLGREVEVKFSGYNKNLFSSLVGAERFYVSGAIKASTSAAPKTDFYMLIDTSPSMLIASTEMDIARLRAATNGCAFACHETSNPRSNLDIARSQNITLRYDVVIEAVQRLMGIAKDASKDSGTTYRAGIYSFDYAFRRIWPKYAQVDGAWVDPDLDQVKAHTADAQPLAYCTGYGRLCDVDDDSQATNFTAAMNGLNSAIPTPGEGTSSTSDRPRAVAMLITDGMRDELSGVNGRTLGPIPVELCDKIKARGILLAVLYTAYLPESATGDWAITRVRDPFLTPKDVISPALTACASPGLFHEVKVHDDLASSASQLFQRALKTARLVN